MLNNKTGWYSKYRSQPLPLRLPNQGGNQKSMFLPIILTHSQTFRPDACFPGIEIKSGSLLATAHFLNKKVILHWGDPAS
jgi:hypothetical protein